VEVAEELVQDAFAATYRDWTRLDEPAAYVRTAVVNRARSELRHHLPSNHRDQQAQPEKEHHPLQGSVPISNGEEVIDQHPTYQGEDVSQDADKNTNATLRHATNNPPKRRQPVDMEGTDTDTRIAPSVEGLARNRSNARVISASEAIGCILPHIQLRPWVSPSIGVGRGASPQILFGLHL